VHASQVGYLPLETQRKVPFVSHRQDVGTALPVETVPRSVTCARPLARALFCVYLAPMKELDQKLTKIFETTKVVACVGMSPNPARPSNYVSRYLQEQGYRVIPVNPGHAGQVILGEVVQANLSDIEGPVDMIDIFRRSEHVLPVVQEALAAWPDLKTVWMQLGVESPQAAALAEARGITVIQNRCPKIDHPRLFGHTAK
jgi:predicted CoA-binding protein